MVDVFFFGVAGIKSESANDDLRKKQKLVLLKQFYMNGRPIIPYKRLSKAQLV